MDNEGRYILCDMMANGKNITLVNLYAPNDDNPNFFNTLFTHFLDFQCEEIIIGGDFYLVLDIEKDKSGGLARTHLNAKKVVNDFCENMDLVDAWRILNPDIRRFTWRLKHPEVHCRLDFFLVSQSILGNVTRTDITPGFQTDHSMISLNISSHTNKRGSGFWKLNTSLLNEETYVNLMKETIRETQDEYKDDASVSPTLLWDMIKLKVRENLLSLLRKKKKRKTCNKQAILENTISRLEKELESLNLEQQRKESILENLEASKLELEEIVKMRTKGAILRCKAKWYNEGEKNTQYFLNLEKRHFKLSTISQLKTRDNTYITSDKDILSTAEVFYRDLYRSPLLPMTENDYFENVNTSRLDQSEVCHCEGLLTKQERFEALKDNHSDKSPGSDGLPAEFYSTFWNEIAGPLLKALNHAYETGNLSITQKRGIIKLIPKKDADPHLIKKLEAVNSFKL